MNCILCIYENKCLESLYEFLVDNGIIKDFHCCLIFDGKQVLDIQYNINRLTKDFLNVATIHIKKQVGIILNIKIKEFDEGFDIDLNTIQTNPHSSLKSYEETKIEFEETHFKIRHPPMIVSKKLDEYEFQKVKCFKESYEDIQYLGQKYQLLG